LWIPFGTKKAINNTTVEVTFAEEVKDLAALNFAIEGLTISNKVVKQTDKKTVVLTTAAQESGKEYTVTVNGDTVGKFAGISAVIPTAIKVTTPSVQGAIGKDVTVSAEVTVPEGQSKAGIPVTFNITNDNSNLNEKIEVVAYTNDKGIASHTYTRYYKNNDNVAAYATQKSSVVSYGKVFWAESLTIKEVTEGNVLTNGNKKIYEISSPEHANGFVNVTFKENVQVTPDKLVSTVSITDAPVYVKNSNGTLSLASNKYPYEVTTGGVQLAIVKLNAAGKATFTIEGSNATVTPVVFVDGTETYSTTTGLTTWTGDGKLDARELQATAPSVKFELNHTLGLAVKPEGVQNAAATTSKGQGGRNYTVTLTDVKTGKVAPAGSTIQVVFPKGSFSTDKAVYIERLDANGDAYQTLISQDTVYTISVTGTKGEASFKLVGAKDGFATPTVYVENDKVAGLSDGDLRQVSETTYFVDAVINKSALTTYSSTDLDEETTTIGNGENAVFKYESVDQNGFPYYAGNGDYEVTYTVSPQFADVWVSGNGLTTQRVNKGTTVSVKVKATSGVAFLTVQSVQPELLSNVTVSASSSQITLEDTPATVTFSKYSSTVVSGVATTAGTDELIINDKLYSFAGANYQYLGSTITKAKFKEYVAANTATVSVTKDAEGKLTFNVLSVGTTPGAVLDSVNIAIESGSVTQVKLALRAFPEFAALSDADQTTVATAIELGGVLADTEALETALETEIAAVKQTAFEDSVADVVTAAGATGATYATLIAAVKEVPGAEASVTALNKVTDTAIRTQILSVVAGLTATAIDTDAATFNTAITNAIATATTNVSDAALIAALADVNGASSATDMEDVLEENASVLGVNISGLTPAQLTSAATYLYNNIPAVDYTKATFQDAFAIAVDFVAPVLESAVYDTAAGTITLTFSEAIALDAAFDEDVDLAAADLAGTAISLGTTADTTTALSASISATNNKQLVITLGDTADTLRAGDYITTVANVTDIKGNDLAAFTRVEIK